jgi:pimeloyl-ACP methyl ester carboxylesterase
MKINLQTMISPAILLLIIALCGQLYSAPVLAATEQGEYFKLDDISMYVEQHGKGEPIIFIHGGMGSAKAWTDQVEFFAKHYRVITPESRGQARTTDGKVPLTYHLMAEDIIHLMDKLQIPSAYIVGWSDGGNIGIDLAIHHPERIKKLVAYGANINPAGQQANSLEYLRTATPKQMQSDNGSDYLALAPHPENLPIIVEKIRKLWLNEPQFTPAQLASITTPTLVMDGQEEELIRPDHAKEIAAAIPNAKLVMLPNVGHFATFETPVQWNQAVANFLKAN